MAKILVNVEFNIAAAREHVVEVERTIINVKECGIGVINTLPYSYLPPQIVIHLVYFILFWFNALQSGKGVYQKYSPR